MPTIGIIAEYNPFHSGHRHHIQTVRRTFGANSAIVCAMSGNWVQRGQPALADKWTRAALALAQGVDLVLELPTLWAAASAEPFARGGVGLLAATGVVDILSFGSEAGDLAPSNRRPTVSTAPPGRQSCAGRWIKGFPSPPPARPPPRPSWEALPTAWASPTTTWAWSICSPSAP